MANALEQATQADATGAANRQHVGIFTGGGVCPGLNAVIAGATIALKREGHEVVGLPRGWKWAIDKTVRHRTVALSEWTDQRPGRHAISRKRELFA